MDVTKILTSGSTVKFSDHRKAYSRGTPLGPALFSLVIHEIITAISEEVPGLQLNQWYLDDGVIAGKADDVLKAFNIIRKLGPELSSRTCPNSAQRAPLAAFPQQNLREGCLRLIGYRSWPIA